MFKKFNFTKKYFRNQSDNNYLIGMDKTPIILFGFDKKIGINHTIVNEQIFWKRDYRLIKKEEITAMCRAFNSKKSEHEKF